MLMFKFNRLIFYLELNNILYNYQFGFRKNHSTSRALIDVMDNIYENLDASLTVMGIYLIVNIWNSLPNHVVAVNILLTFLKHDYRQVLG